MKAKIFRPIMKIGLALAVGIAWAATTTYSGSVVVEPGEGGVITLVQDGANQVKVQIKAGSLDAYMAEEGLDEVEVMATFTEEWVPQDGGIHGHYKVSFEFGQSGAFFDPALTLKIKGKWAATDSEFWLYDENGEEIEGRRIAAADMIKYKIRHFSCYYYEQYCD